MKALATLKNVDSNTCKDIIVRNLSRILDIRIIDVDVENGMICFLYNGQRAFDQVKKELGRIGHPIRNYTNDFPKNEPTYKGHGRNLSTYTPRARMPYLLMDR